MVATDEGARKMAEAKVIGNLPPATTFSLMEDTWHQPVKIAGKKDNLP